MVIDEAILIKLDHDKTFNLDHMDWGELRGTINGENVELTQQDSPATDMD